MDEVTKAAMPLAAPFAVEESRAQRLQRQQARFRDRGGIFVPTARNTLADILLKRTAPGASPKKSPKKNHARRSASCSPVRKSKGKERSDNQEDSETQSSLHASRVRKNTRSSPRKGSRKPTVSKATEEEPIAGPSRLTKTKATKKSTTSRNAKLETHDDESRASGSIPKRRGRPPKITPEQSDATLAGGVSKAKPATRKRRKVIASDDPSDEEPDPNLKPTRKRAAASVHKKPVAQPRSRAKSTTTKVTNIESDNHVENDVPEEATDTRVDALTGKEAKRKKGNSGATKTAAPTRKLKAKASLNEPLVDELTTDVALKPALKRRGHSAKPKGTYTELSDDEQAIDLEAATNIPKKPPLPNKTAETIQSSAENKHEQKAKHSDCSAQLELNTKMSTDSKRKQKNQQAVTGKDNDVQERPRKKGNGDRKDDCAQILVTVESVGQAFASSDTVTKKRPREPAYVDGDSTDIVGNPKAKRVKQAPKGNKLKSNAQASERLTSILENPIDLGSKLEDKGSASKGSNVPAKKRSRDTKDAAEASPKRRRVSFAGSVLSDKAGRATNKEANEEVSEQIGNKVMSAQPTESKVASRKLKENSNIVVKKLKQPVKKRAATRGPPASVLNRIRNPLPHTDDSEPDEIDFLS